MTRHNRKPTRAKLLRSLFIWHRHLGLASALFVILLAVTGLLLSHTGDLALDTHYIRSAFLLDWYGIRAPEAMPSYKSGAIAVTEVGTRVYWNTTPLPQAPVPLLGVVAAHELIIIGAGQQLLLFTPDGELVERMDSAAGIPADIRSLGTTADGNLAVRTPHGVFVADESIQTWHDEAADASIRWATPRAPAAALRAALQAAYRGNGLTLERVLLDIHTGRILGNRGVYLVDAAALLFLLLATSGVWLWGRHLAAARKHRTSSQSHP
jgi:hypothetical protein